MQAIPYSHHVGNGGGLAGCVDEDWICQVYAAEF